MRRALLALTAAAILAASAAPAGAVSTFKEADLAFSESDGSPAMAAGSHPFAMTAKVAVQVEEPSPGEKVPLEEGKDVIVQLPAGLAGTPTPVPRCSVADFLFITSGFPSHCPDATALGVAHVLAFGADTDTPIYNLYPAPGIAAKIGFVVEGVPVSVDVGVNPNPPYNIFSTSTNISQAVVFYSARLSVWGNPASSAHDADRGICLGHPGKSCPVAIPVVPYLTMPTRCEGPLLSTFEADYWQNPGIWVSETVQTHDNAEPPNPLGTHGCAKIAFAPKIDAQPTTDQAESPSGLDFRLDIHDENLTNPGGIAGSDLKKAVVTLPEGVTANPSQAEGLGVCSEADLAEELPGSQFGDGCPAASKIGTVEVETPLLEGTTLHGSLFIADPYKNRFGSLLALYIVIKDPGLGIELNIAGRVAPDPQSGQLISTFEDLPQFPFSHFRLHFREGGRSPLITPAQCGDYQTEAVLTPWANPANPLTTTASFQITRGVGGGPCPPAGRPPFAPGFAAGTLNNAAGHYSPFYMRLTRRDGDQDLTRFSAILPPGMVAKLAGTTRCPDAAIAAAKAKSGKEEQAAPSCPASSQIGRAVGGAGVGSELTYVSGKLYMAGPYNGAPLSVVAIVPAVAGPFDVGDVVVRQALRIDPRTAEVTADGAASDPLPHILAGIPLRVRDIRVYVDRPEFTLNPTSCEPSAVGAQLWGGGSDVFSSLDDSPLSLSARFQAAGCASLGFKPRLALSLEGGTRRGAHPALHGLYKPGSGDANLKRLVLRLPRSAFLDQGHIRTICTRVQFAAHACPQGAVYGHARVFTPILEDPLEGPVYLRSSNHNLPDFVADLHGLVDFEAVARIDSVQGGIRASFEDNPDAPLSKVSVDMQGGRKGLIVNSTDLCAAKHRANAKLTGQNGKVYDTTPVLRAKCKGGKHKRHKSHRRHG